MASQKYIALFIISFILTACKGNNDQNPVTPVMKGKIAGIITEANTDIPLSNVKITTSPKTKETYSDTTGYFFLDDIVPGDYIIYAYKPGYDYDSIFITVQADLTSEAEIRLINFSEYLDYYPLDIGNYWEYWNYPSMSPYQSYEIISDSTISFVAYKVILRKDLQSGEILGFNYERVDSFNALVYRYFPEEGYEMIIDSLPAKAGQRFTSNMFIFQYVTCSSTCTTIDDQIIFNEIRTLRSMYHSCGHDLPWYQLVKGLGVFSFGWPRSTSSRMLKYASIRGVDYGDQ